MYAEMYNVDPTIAWKNYYAGATYLAPTYMLDQRRATLHVHTLRIRVAYSQCADVVPHAVEKKSFQPYQVIIINLVSTKVCSMRCVWSNKDLSNCMHLVCFDIIEVLIKTKSASYLIEPLTTRTVHFFYPLPNCISIVQHLW